MNQQQYQVMQGVKVSNETNERFGQAGCVVGWTANYETIEIRMDADSAVVAFAATDIQAL